MDKPTSRERVYVFDASIFIALNRINETAFEVPEGVWDKLTELMNLGRIISQRIVYEEVVTNSKKPDKVSAWLAPKKEYFPKETPEQVKYMIEIVRAYPKLVNPDYEREQADPWLVALARDMSVKDEEREYVLVTQESLTRTTNLPAAARAYGIESINLRQFFEEQNISLGVKD